MIRREFAKALPLLGLGNLIGFRGMAATNGKPKDENDREYWVNAMIEIGTPAGILEQGRVAQEHARRNGKRCARPPEVYTP